MKKYFIPLFLLVLLFGCTSSKPHLSVMLSKTSPAHPYEGDVLTFDANILNSGAGETKEFSAELLVNNISVGTGIASLAPNSNTTMKFSWTPLYAGDYGVVVKVDAGNLVSESSPEKESKMQVSVSPAEKADIFSTVPDNQLTGVALSNLSAEGLNVVYSQSEITNRIPPYLGILSQSIGFLKPYSRTLRELQIGTGDYEDFSTAVVILVRGAVSPEQIAASTGASLETKFINNREISLFKDSSSNLTLCSWRENGWLKLLLYQRMFTNETCEDVIGAYNSSYANALLSTAEELVRTPPFNATFLGETLHTPNATRMEYGAVFEDEEGFYEFHILKEPYVPNNETCSGFITNRSMMQICENLPSGDSTWTWVQRKTGDYSMICVSVPKGNVSSEVGKKAVDMCYSFNFSGEERTWLRFIDLLKPKCEFPDNFTCLSYDFSNSTFRLNLTQNTGRAVVLNGFKCTSENYTPKQDFKLNESLTIAPNSSVELEVPCYDEFGGMVREAYVYFNSNMYINYSFEGSNESKVTVGNLTIKKI